MFNGVSTIMPVFLHGVRPSGVGNLLRAAGSVLAQSCDIPMELVIVDDGSQPSVASVPELQSLLEDPRVRIVSLLRNQGLVYALNAGLTQSRYDLIARVDDDDYWYPGKLRRQLEVFASDPDLTLVGTSMRVVHSDDHSLDRDELRGGSWGSVLEFFEKVGCPFPHGSILARKDVFDILGGYPHLPDFAHCEDFALWGSWIRFFKVAITDEVLFEYTISGHQVSSRFAEQQGRATGIVRRTFLALDDRHRIPAAVGAIAAKLGVSVFAASQILCSAWIYYDEILVDEDLYEPARIVFSDRAVHRCGEAPDLQGKRVFRLYGGDLGEACIRDAAVGC